MAGWWLGCVSLLLFQFLLLRLHFPVIRSRPGSCGKCHTSTWSPPRRTRTRRSVPAFLGGIIYAFSPVLLAQGATLTGTTANRIFFYAGAKLPDFRWS